MTDVFGDSKLTNPVKIIDLFSGPGGLGEGFSATRNEAGNPDFKIAVSIEKEKSAHSTLLLRAFYRQFGDNVPAEYYEFLKGNLGKKPEEQLYPLFEKQYIEAQNEARCLTLGQENKKIYKVIRKAIGNEDCILIGGPPCQAYSVVGRARNMGITGYDADEDHRNFLYLEYLKVIAKFQPMIFVMENVKGMLSAKVGGKPIFDSIYKDLKSPCTATGMKPEGERHKHNYKIFSLVTANSDDDTARDPRDFIIRTENHNIPQRRHRVILLGIREDLAVKWNNSMLLPISNHQITVDKALSGMPELRSGVTKRENNDDKWIEAVKTVSENVIPALEASDRKELRLVGTRMKSVLKTLQIFNDGQGSNFGTKARKPATGNKALNEWFTDSELEGYLCNNQTRSHIVTDLHRYLFCSAWASIVDSEGWSIKTPKSHDYIKELHPNHANFTTGKFADRFRVQIASSPATTITSHISKDGHYFIHPDPKQCRSLTVREAARLQTFPDNYFFVGNRTEQYVQVGNAVPPYLAFQIANTLKKILAI